MSKSHAHAAREASTFCAQCYEATSRAVCLQCNGEAMSNAAETAVHGIFAATHDLYTGMDDCRVSVPEDWHEKPFARFTHEHDAGDATVGIGPRSAWVFAADQSGTVLAELIGKAETQGTLIAATRRAYQIMRGLDLTDEAELPTAVRQVSAARSALAAALAPFGGVV